MTNKKLPWADVELVDLDAAPELGSTVVSRPRIGLIHDHASVSIGTGIDAAVVLSEHGELLRVERHAHTYQVFYMHEMRSHDSSQSLGARRV